MLSRARSRSALSLSAYMPKLGALRDFRVDNSSLSHAHIATFVRAADTLHNLYYY